MGRFFISLHTAADHNFKNYNIMITDPQKKQCCEAIDQDLVSINNPYQVQYRIKTSLDLNHLGETGIQHSEKNDFMGAVCRENPDFQHIPLRLKSPATTRNEDTSNTSSITFINRLQSILCNWSNLGGRYKEMRRNSCPVIKSVTQHTSENVRVGAL